MFTLLTDISGDDVATEWDALAPVRHHQIVTEKDVTWHHVLAPAMIRLIREECPQSTIDVGCGTGYLTHLLGGISRVVIGIDPSSVSIQLAKLEYPTVAFACTDIATYARQTDDKFDLISANMVLHDAPDADNFLESATSLLRTKGSLIFTIPHPCFFPIHYGYDGADWYTYNKTLIIKSEYKTSGISTPFPTTHVHRPLSRYFELFKVHGFIVDYFEELYPNLEVMQKYDRPWQFPRYIAGKLRLS